MRSAVVLLLLLNKALLSVHIRPNCNTLFLYLCLSHTHTPDIDDKQIRVKRMHQYFRYDVYNNYCEVDSYKPNMTVVIYHCHLCVCVFVFVCVCVCLC